MRARSTVGHLAIAACAVVAASPARAGDALELQARGVQIYTCAASDGGFAWHFKAPEATLVNAQGENAGHHFAGPSWQAPDGSVVAGEVVISSSGQPGAVPWLILHAKSHSGTGLFAAVQYVVRSHTVGGAAPAGGCDKDHAGTEARVDYTASYTFFTGQDAAKP